MSVGGDLYGRAAQAGSHPEPGLVLRPIMSNGFPPEKPGNPFSTINAEIPANPFLLSVDANTRRRSAIGAFVMNIFEPLRMYRSPFFTAPVFMLRASDPESGSVIAWPPIRLPLHRSGRYLRFCCSVPNFQIGFSHVQI